jgi:hypothetical protein
MLSLVLSLKKPTKTLWRFSASSSWRCNTNSKRWRNDRPDGHGLVENLDVLIGQQGDHGIDDFLLALEVGVKRRRRVARLARDVLHGGVVQPDARRTP